MAAEIVAALTELSSEIRRVALVAADGKVLAVSSGADGERLARVAAELFDLSETTAPSDASIVDVRVDLPEGGVIACRDAGRIAVATTTPEPAAALVLHDLRTCLGRLDEADRPRRRRRPAARVEVDADA